MDRETVRLALSNALNELVKRDSYLLTTNINERSISHRLAVYLESQFPNWDVDCEYNRNHDDVKRLRLKPRRTTDHDMEAVTVFPDIIVHRRRLQKNLLVIEIKKSTNNEEQDRDFKKLMEFVRHPDYDYEFGLFLEIGTDHHIEEGLWAHAIWFHCEGNVAVKKLEKVYKAPRK